MDKLKVFTSKYDIHLVSRLICCEVCNQPASFFCNRCQVVKYCSKSCMKKDRPHGLVCGKSLCMKAKPMIHYFRNSLLCDKTHRIFSDPHKYWYVTYDKERLSFSFEKISQEEFESSVKHCVRNHARMAKHVFASREFGVVCDF